MRTKSRIRVAVFATLALVAVAASPALAHTVLTGTSPGDGSTVASVERVRLEFADSLLDVGARISVVGDDDVDYAVGDVTFPKQGIAQVGVSDLPAGDYTVQWRVVAADGHPLEGAFAFSVATASDSPGTAPDADPSPLASPSASDPSPSPSRLVIPPPDGLASQDDDGVPWLLVIGGVVIALVGGALAAIMVSRARARRA